MTRFELCVNVPINITVVLAYAVNGEGTLYYVPLKYEVEMWAELANNSRTWDVTANIKTVLPIDPTEVPVPVTITQTGALNCSNDPYCTESSQSPVEETNNLGMYTGDGSVTTLKGSFSDATTTATETLDNYLSIDLGTESPWTKTQGAPILMPFGGENVQNPIRCDNQSKIPGYTNGGCIVRYAPAVWTVSDKLYPGMDLVVKHMAAASCQLPGYQGLDGCPGKPGATPLTYDPSKEDANRGKACPSTMQPPPNQVALGNTSCDEYPMAKTDQGAASGGPYDTCWVPPAENSSQGGAFTTGLVGPSRMFPGDSFYVHVTYFGNTPGCDGLLVGGGSVTPDNGLDGMFNSYGDNATCADWSGGDATNSVALPDGERAWFFSDTYLNSPAARKSLWYASSLHNSMVIQDSSGLTQTITGGNTCQETNQSISFWNRYAITPAVAPDASTGGFYWTGDQMVVGSNVVKFYYHGHPVTLPGGGHSFTIDYPAVATIPVGSLEGSPVINITPTHFSCGASNIIWGTSLLNWDGNVYVYGWQSTGTGSDGIFLAKTTEASLTSTGSWQLYDGMSGSNPVWGSCSSTPAPLPISNGTTGFSVDFVNNSLWLVQFDYTNGQANAAGAIGAHPSATPWGFGNSTVALYDP
ncbi:MAG: NucA/NucB deoxyribonuclease domain-containing protein, partial [Streptosporangiaceae bacterium]